MYNCISNPKGISSAEPGPNKSCKLIKFLYVFKQASNKLYEQLSTCLCGWCHSSLVDNFLAQFASIKSTLHDSFEIKDLKYFFGLEVALFDKGLCQRMYFLDLLLDACLTGLESIVH